MRTRIDEMRTRIDEIRTRIEKIRTIDRNKIRTRTDEI